MELAPAARRELLSRPAVTGYVQGRVFKYKLDQHVDQKGTRAVVVAPDGGWAQPNPVNTPAFQLLRVECWADCSREDDGHGRLEKAAGDAIDNAWALYRAVDRELHPPGGIRGVRWGAVGSDPGLLVVTCQRWTEPNWHDADNPDGSGRNFGEAAMVTTTYALQLSYGRD
ncbi:hypothetical protein [Actinomycetospora termitidis]|uniref:Uncharacterized protein n=1 Tax=Actinomycetospora termitidis TaxID=3053470 RepID=A0ABT7MFG5_9PSEU|nr:hypothetical protein [Actinomycetospora sp. Odt1-22]MDL5159408.1 hypothetical protein [Actinomycetospora sp. Odt1-22]